MLGLELCIKRDNLKNISYEEVFARDYLIGTKGDIHTSQTEFIVVVSQFRMQRTVFLAPNHMKGIRYGVLIIIYVIRKYKMIICICLVSDQYEIIKSEREIKHVQY